MGVVSIPGFSEPFSSLSHLLGALVFTGFSILLLRRGRGNWARILSLAIFSFGTVLLLSISGTYHALDPTGGARKVLQRLDHAAIFVLIACSFTPGLVILFRGVARWGILLWVWTFAAIAITLKMIYFANISPSLGLAVYLSMGAIGILPCAWIWRRFGFELMQPIFWGGLAYAVGGILDSLHWPLLVPGVVQWHEVFHVAVLIGLGFHWAFAYTIADGRLGPEV